MNTRRISSLLTPFFFFTSVHVEQTVAPAIPVIVGAKSETLVPQRPDQYFSWKATLEQSECVNAPTEDPRLVIPWAGYPFLRDYNKPRGHVFAMTDVRETLRTGTPKNAEDGPLPMTCWSCKSPNVARLIQKDGEDGYFHGKWARDGPEIVNNLGCADCRGTASPRLAKGRPELTLSRPYAARAMEAIGKPFERAGRSDQQLMVYGWRHMEYYFDGKNRTIKFPWDDGMKVGNMRQYYDRITSSDWTNSLSETPMLKAQHPEYGTWTADIRGRNSMTRIDCHISKVQNAEGKFYVDHKISNPFNNSTQTCTNCHTQDKAALQKVIAERKQSINDLKIKVEDQLIHAYFEAEAALDAGVTEAEMKPVQDDIHYAQWRQDLVIAPHGARMHAPEGGLRMLGMTVDRVADACTKPACSLATKGVIHKVQTPDVPAKEKAQQAIGLNVEQIKTEKQDLIKTAIPRWEEQAHKDGLSS